MTEGILLNDTDETLAILAELREMGVRIAMDDFGTGYSSLGYLQKFPFNKIKIDQCFIRDIEVHTDRQAIFRAVTTLASTLHMKTVAEGVETEAELTCIRAAGCDEVQGFLTGQPMSAGAAIAMLELACSAEPF